MVCPDLVEDAGRQASGFLLSNPARDGFCITDDTKTGQPRSSAMDAGSFAFLVPRAPIMFGNWPGNFCKFGVLSPFRGIAAVIPGDLAR